MSCEEILYFNQNHIINSNRQYNLETILCILLNKAKSECVNSIKYMMSQAKSYKYKIKEFKDKRNSNIKCDLEISINSWFYFSWVLSTKSLKIVTSQPQWTHLTSRFWFLSTIVPQRESELLGEMDSMSVNGNCKMSIGHFCTESKEVLKG